LTSYGGNLLDAFGQAGRYVGADSARQKARRSPIQQSTKFEPAINLETAKALGLVADLARTC
jgi:putative ABC transport system substrate-binding protein